MNLRDPEAITKTIEALKAQIKALRAERRLALLQQKARELGTGHHKAAEVRR